MVIVEILITRNAILALSIKDKILEKYNFPILRFRTNESGEKEKLIDKLIEIQLAG